MKSLPHEKNILIAALKHDSNHSNT